MKLIAHDYQKYCSEFIENNKISAILLECGLGKSSITLMAIKNLLFDYFLSHKILIIAPLRVCINTWPTEVTKWDDFKDLKVSLCVGKEQERIDGLRRKADIYIINRENVEWLVKNFEREFDFDTVVIDELSSFKSHKSNRFKYLYKVRSRVNRIIGLTGTPSSNGLADLFAEYKILDGGLRLGMYITQFRNNFFIPDKRNGNIIYSYKIKDGGEDAIYERIKDITISMKTTDYLKMPELVKNNLLVELSNDDKKRYKEFKKEMVLKLKDNEITAKTAATLSNKLLQMANGSVYDDDKVSHHIHDVKLDELENVIEMMNGKPILVAYWFNEDLKRIKERFPGAREIKTNDDINDWNNKKISIGLIQPQSAGYGLNLQDGGSNIVWFSLTWNLELYEQLNARLYRQGQKSDSVVIHHIVCKGTIDEQVIKALENKKSVQDDLLNAVKANLKD